MHIHSAHPSRPAAVLRVSGEDHVDFLHNQGTADLRGESGFCRYALWLDFQGKIHFDAFVLKLSDSEMLLVSYCSPAASLIEKFDKHIIADDVEITDETDGWQLLSIPSDQAGTCPEPGEFIPESAGYAYSGRLLGPGSIDCLLPQSIVLPESFEAISQGRAEKIRISAGIPMVPMDTGMGLLNPVECGILSAVSFDKGCYLGQEVVARVHRLDRVSRRLVRFSFAGPVPALPFDLLRDESTLGGLTSAAEVADGFLALGWLKSRIPDGGLRVNEVDFLVEPINPS